MKENNLCEKMGAFAREHILPLRDLGTATAFPRDIWSAMGGQGLLNPEALGEHSPCLGMAETARAMVTSGGNLGLALSWLIHMMTARYLVRPHLTGILDTGFWDRIKTGEATVSFAVSEPGAGAHPKYMAALAQKEGDHYLLSGEKAYLTNGPIADSFIVIAVTGEERGTKRFSAFILPQNTPGLSLGPPMEMPFFKPSPHGSIKMEACRLGLDRLLGEEGRAFNDMVLPFRRLEDAAMTGAVSGAMDFVLSRAAREMGRSSTIGSEQLEALGELKAGAEAGACLSDRIAGMADQGEGPLESLGIYFRQTAARFINDLDRLLSDTHTRLSGRAEILARDLASSGKIGKTVSNIKKQKLGRRFLDQNRRP